MKVKFIFVALATLLIQCKSSNIGQGDVENVEVTPIILLLTDNLSPADLETVKLVKVESMKRVSRAQNQWMLRIEGDKSVAVKLLQNLKEESNVLEAYLDGDKPSTKKDKN